MQIAEEVLQQLAQALITLASNLMGMLEIEAPHSPLAMTALLQALTPGMVNLGFCTHPVIQV